MRRTPESSGRLDLGDACRIVLSAAALCALATWLVWTTRPDWIVALDRWLVQRYEAGYREPLAAATAELERDPAAGVAELEALLDDLAEIRKGNRAAPFRRQAFSEVTTALLEIGEPERALQHAGEWVAFDPQDLEARVRHAVALREASGLQAGLDAVRELFEKLPGSALVCRLYVTWLLEAGRDEDAASAFFVFLRAGGRPGAPPADGELPTWSVHWDLGNGFLDGQSMAVAAVLRDGQVAVPFELPAGVRRVRVELPRHARFTLVAPRLTVRAAGREVVTPLSELDFQVNQLTVLDEGLEAFGASDPYLFFAMPTLPASFSVELTAAVRRPSAGWVARVLALPAAGRLGEELTAATGPVLAHVAEDYRRIRDSVLEGR